MIENIILVAVIFLILGGAAYYVYRQKKKGTACIGCPHAKDCKKNACCAEHKR